MRRRIQRVLLTAITLLAVPLRAAWGQEPRTSQLGAATVSKPKVQTIVKNGKSRKKVDILFVADGYLASEEAKYFKSAKNYSTELFKLAPFSWYKNKFNVRALFAPSKSKKLAETLLKSYFDRPKGRLLQFGDRRVLRNLVRKGGQVNITLGKKLGDKSFDSLKKTVKWKHFLELPGAAKFNWIWEGGYYRSKGVFRPWKNCLMRNFGFRFCPICMEEMAKAIFKNCGEDFDHEAYHKAHPLSFWGKGSFRR